MDRRYSRHFKATALKGADGRPFISFEPSEEGIGLLGDGFITIELRPDTTIDQAEELAAMIRKLSVGLAFNVT